ncbi:ParB/RepB/Spo0J family partition protein [Caulobacter endophyticus]|uniref:Chromosome partitioning protein ParB n=1 Tax=Caulobacter endophyticus TaxID=2172652 RepID=A0A2T9JEF5_9CAUL|nr:ParB/RepB/Spo0J family partition protein [Caulobacter endophyticus]PVM82075.1 chromosome partitioning protein ParB [Caulobacter endophyticus]
MTTSQTPATAPNTGKMAAPPTPVVVQYGEVRDIPLSRLKASPKNARRVGHSAEVIESRAASITYKGVLQPLVVEPEVKDGRETGYYLVSAGEGRRQALRLLAKRKLLAKGAAVRCVVDTSNDPAEVSMDENLSREPMHPADQFEAFKDLAERKGYGAEEIGARFGVKPDIVRQRLRLGAVAPALLDLYREEVLTLDQVTAFAVNPDPARQLQVYEQLPTQGRQPFAIRRAMTETKVAADDRRVQFVGLDAYVAAGGPVLRDLFTQDNEGWVEDIVLLDRLVGEKLADIAQAVRDDEGWMWSAAYIDFPQGHGCSRIWERVRQRSPEEVEAINVLQTEEAELTDRWAEIDPPPPEVAARFEAIEAALDAYGEDFGFDPVQRAYAGVFVSLNAYGEAKIDRGFVRLGDEPAPEPDEDDTADETADEDDADAIGDDLETGDPDPDDEDGEPDGVARTEPEEPAGDPAAPLPDRVVAELTAHRTAALRDALAQDPDLAQVALVHALVCRVFGSGGYASCLDIRWGSRDLSAVGEGIDASPAGVAIAQRHQGWARQMPTKIADFWDFIVGLDGDSRAALLAHCVSLTLDGLRSWERREASVLAHVETLATALDLDMRVYWKPTAVRYLDRVTKAHVIAAVGEAVSSEAAARLSGLKKPDMVAAAEPQLVEAGWLPAVLRTAKSSGQAVPDGACAEVPAPADDPLALVEEVAPVLGPDDLAPRDLEQSAAEAAEVVAILEAAQ